MRLLIFLTAFILASPSARADWQFTTWGMSPTELDAAAAKAGFPVRPGTGSRVPFSKADVQRVGDYEASGFRFTVQYGFEDEKLGSVRLALRPGPECWSLHNVMKERYGRPDQDFTGPLKADLRWRDAPNRNFVWSIVIRSSPPECELIYRPLSGGGL